MGNEVNTDNTGSLIAVIGMAGRFPESENIEQFWRHLESGDDCLHAFSPAELKELGIPESSIAVDNFVAAGTRFPGADCFDAEFFGFTPREASTIDPQCRVFLETCYEALEDAGCDPFQYPNDIGVFAGSNPNDYAALIGPADPRDSLSAFDQLIGSDKDFLTTRVSHRLNLRGPSVTVQTACSTSLVAVHMAVQSLLSFECSVAMAGGVCLNFRQGIGYFHQPGMILSPEGKCKAFDAEATGTTLGQACGVVVLKRYEDALADRDNISAVIRATAINNDGSNKVGYTAPSEKGQAAVISVAHELAEVGGEDISYVEAHGTATRLGDPVEIAGLTQAFRRSTEKSNFCAIGSVKTNIGHTDAAAGISGFIKTVLCLKNKTLVPSIGYQTPNAEIDFPSTPFYVNTTSKTWESSDAPRIAGVSAFGIGGTNAHVVVSEALPEDEIERSFEKNTQLFILSAKTDNAADQQVEKLIGHINSTKDCHFSDIGFTLRQGRAKFSQRRAFIASKSSESADQNAVIQTGAVKKGSALDIARRSVWMFSGQGSQYAQMTAGLYRDSIVFKKAFDQCAELFLPLLGRDIRSLVLVEGNDSALDRANEALRQTTNTQPALFTVQHSLASYFRSLGHKPDLLVGHSVGEYAAAVQAEIISLEDAVRVVAKRGELMQSMAAGSMLSVSLSGEEVLQLLPDTLDLAAYNSSHSCVVAGPTNEVDEFANMLGAEGVRHQKLRTSHAFHSRSMESASLDFEALVKDVTWNPTKVPMLSNITGLQITDSEATDPAFWASQIRQPVRFTQCVSVALAQPSVFLELGPGSGLSMFVELHDEYAMSESVVCSSVRSAKTKRPDYDFALEAMGQVWCAGGEVDWSIFDQKSVAKKTSLPTYPFARTRHWRPAQKHMLAMPEFGGAIGESVAVAYDKSQPLVTRSIDEWLYTPSWSRIPTPVMSGINPGTALVLVSDCPAGRRMENLYRQCFSSVLFIRHTKKQPGEESSDVIYVDINTENLLGELIDSLYELGKRFSHFVHAASVCCPDLSDMERLDATAVSRPQTERLEFNALMSRGLLSALEFVRGVSRFDSGEENIRIDFVTAGANSIMGDEAIDPVGASLAGVSKVAPLEYPFIKARQIDLNVGDLSVNDELVFIKTTLETDTPANIGIRSGQLWQWKVEQKRWTSNLKKRTSELKQGGCYLIVGGLGGVGLSIANHLATEYSARLILTSRNGKPVADASDAETTKRLALLQEIETAAESLQVCAADIGNYDAMSALVNMIESEYGAIDGVVVAAGISDQSGAIHRRDRAASQRSMEAKVVGSQLLIELFASRSPDFLLFSSSIATVLYHNRFAQVGYVGGNSYAEAAACNARTRGINAFTVAWDDWLDIGMSVRAAIDFGESQGTSISLVDEQNSFAPKDGVQLFERALLLDEPVLFVSPTCLKTRIEEDLNVISPFLKQALDEEDEVVTDGTESLSEHLKSAWIALLGVADINEDDDFFELGGDSLQAARMGDRLSRQFGKSIPLNLLFDNSNFSKLLSSLEAFLDREVPSTATNMIDETGPFPLSPAQARFLNRRTPNPNHFNISVLLEISGPTDLSALESAISDLLSQNEALSLRLVSDSGAGTRLQEVIPQPASAEAIVTVNLDESTHSKSIKTQMIDWMNKFHRQLNLEKGRVFIPVLFRKSGSKDHLFLVVHHFVSDRISLLKLLDSLEEFYVARKAGNKPKKLEIGSYRSWISRVGSIANESEVIEKWTCKPWSSLKPLPKDFITDRSDNNNSNASHIEIAIEGAKVAELLKQRYGRPEHVLITAIGHCIAAWSEASAALIDVLGHGRNLFDEVNISSTTGFFLTYNPVFISNDQDKISNVPMANIQTQLDEGWEFDALRFVSKKESVRSVFGKFPNAEVLFNFVGREIQLQPGGEFSVIDGQRGDEIDPVGVRDHALSIIALVERDNRLVVRIVYCDLEFEKSTITRLADSVRSGIKNLLK